MKEQNVRICAVRKKGSILREGNIFPIFVWCVCEGYYQKKGADILSAKEKLMIGIIVNQTFYKNKPNPGTLSNSKSIYFQYTVIYDGVLTHFPAGVNICVVSDLPSVLRVKRHFLTTLVCKRKVSFAVSICMREIHQACLAVIVFSEGSVLP